MPKAKRKNARKPKRRAKGHRKNPDPFSQQIGARIAALRAEQDFDWDAFVEEVGLGRGYVSELQRGLVVPTATALAAVANALGVAVADLVLGDTPRERLFAATRGLGPSQLQVLLLAIQELRDSAPSSS